MSEVITGDSCPCCGDVALPKWLSVSKPNKQAPYGLESETRVYYECRKCGLRTKDFSTQKAALGAWNTRAERTCKPLYFEYGEEAHCSECGRRLHYDEHTERDYPPYCGCGAKVVE